MALPIVHYNAPVLRKKGERITTFDASLIQLADQMIETMHAASGIGLAAQQIGRAVQVAVVDLTDAKADFTWEWDGSKPPKDLFMPFAMVNPTFVALPGDETIYEEGCLSFPEIHGDVVRPDAIRATFQDVRGFTHTLLCDGLLSRCIQHEIDHLNGKLFIDRMEKKVRAGIEKDVKELARRTREASGATPATAGEI